MTSRTVVATSIGIAAQKVIDMAVENGIVLGWTRAHKHTDTPDADAIQDAIHMAVMNELGDWLVFPESHDPDRGAA